MYTRYYGFSAKPFQLSPDPRFFFGSSVHKRALAYLRYGLSQKEGFIVITGDIGTGKTTLVQSLFEELNDDSVIASQLVTTRLEANDLLRMVVSSFGLPFEDVDKGCLIQRLEAFLKICARDGKRVLLVVDEAQNLPSSSLEELRMLSNFQISGTPLLQSFLLGQEQFRATLQAPEMEQLCQRVVASCHLGPLSDQESRDYIEHRLRVAGWEDHPRFTDAAYSAIYHYTQGVPRRINIFCDRLLLYGFLEELREFSDTEVAAVGKEWGSEVASPIVSPASRTRDPVQPFSLSAESEKRILELEQAVRALARQPDEKDAQLESLEKRIAKLEPMVTLLRQGLIELIKRINHEVQCR